MNFFDDDFGIPSSTLDNFTRSSLNRFHQQNQRMNHFLSNAFLEGFPSIDDNRKHEKVFQRSCGSSESKQPRIQEPDDENSQPQGYFYCSTTSTYSDGSGVFHAKRKIQDNVHGAKFTETRKIGDKCVSWNRDVDIEGKTYDTETRQNIEDDEIESFAAEWEKRRSNQQRIGHSTSTTNQQLKGKQLALK